MREAAEFGAYSMPGQCASWPSRCVLSGRDAGQVGLFQTQAEDVQIRQLVQKDVKSGEFLVEVTGKGRKTIV